MSYTRLSILLPVRNNRYDIKTVLQAIRAAPLPAGMTREIIVVDDGSTDGSAELLQDIAGGGEELILLRHDCTLGMGACLRTALTRVTGDICVIQDAQLTYDPAEYGHLMAPILDGVADAVLGSRFLPHHYRRVLPFRQSRRHKFVSRVASFLTNRDFTDVLCSFKMFRMLLLKTVPLRCNGAGAAIELLAKLVKRGFRLCEVPVTYRGWSYGAERPLRTGEVWTAVATALVFWIVDDIYEQQYGHDILR